MRAPPSPPILLASTSPQRRAILEQIQVPFDVIAPSYREDAKAHGDPVAVVRSHAVEKARSVAADADGRPILGVDTDVVLDGRIYGKPETAAEAEAMLEALSGRTHEVVSGLCLRSEAWEDVREDVTRVSFRPLTPRELSRYVASGEWEGRAGGYGIQGLGASLVERLDGDYLNVVGLPGGVLVNVLAERFPGVYGFG